MMAKRGVSNAPVGPWRRVCTGCRDVSGLQGLAGQEAGVCTGARPSAHRHPGSRSSAPGGEPTAGDAVTPLCHASLFPSALPTLRKG